MARRVVRFGVGAAYGARYATWRVFKQPITDDVYIGARRIMRHFKVSLHRDGTWLFGFTRQHVASPHSVVPPHQKRQSRFTPTESVPGITRAVSVIVPATEDAVPSYGGAELGEICWHPTPADGRAAVFVISRTSAEALVSGWPGARGSQRTRRAVHSSSAVDPPSGHGPRRRLGSSRGSSAGRVQETHSG
jgi:hypothetical protein